MSILVAVVLQAFASGLPADVLEAINRVNLTGGTAGAVRLKVERTRPTTNGPETLQTLFIKSPSGDMLTVTEGTVDGEPRTAARCMVKGAYMVSSLSTAPVFAGSIPALPSTLKVVPYWQGPAGLAALPRVTMNLAGPLLDADILFVERLNREGDRFEEYRIQTNLYLNAGSPFPNSIVVTFDSATGRVIKTMTPVTPMQAGPVFELSYDEEGRLARVVRKLGGEHMDESWRFQELDLSPTAAPAELSLEMIGLGVGAQVSGPNLGDPTTLSLGFWTGDSGVAMSEFRELGLTISNLVRMQMEERKYTDELSYEFADALVESEMERVRLGLESLSPWKAVVSRFEKAFALPPVEVAKADKILEKAEERVREIATQFSDDRKSAARIELLELQSMRKRSSDDKDRKDQEEQRRARKLFEDFWKELKRLTRADVSAWDRQFEVEAE